jgi:hypothetical protein
MALGEVAYQVPAFPADLAYLIQKAMRVCSEIVDTIVVIPSVCTCIPSC